MATERFDIIITAKGTQRTSREIKRIGKEASSASKTLALLRSGLVVFSSIRLVAGLARLADSLTNIRNRLKLVTGSTETLNAVQAGLFKISQDTRSSFEANATVFARLARSTTNLGLTFQELLDITQGLAQAIAISGAQSQEAKNALIQFSQGLAAGALTGDELRSVVEQLPALADAIGKEFGKSGGELIAFAKAAGNDRILGLERVIKGVQAALPGFSDNFSKLSKTTEQAFTTFNNSLTLFIGGISQSTQIGSRLSVVLQSIANVLPEITVALLALVGIGAFNLLADQVTKFGGTLLKVSGFILSPFLSLARVILLPITALKLLGTTAIATGVLLRGVATGAIFVSLAGSIIKATVALRAFLALGVALTAFRTVLKGLVVAWGLQIAVIRGATVASKAFLAVTIGFQAFATVLRLLTALSLRFVAVLFLNPVVLGFAAIVIGIVAGFLLLRNVIGDLIPQAGFLGRAFEVFSAGVLTGIDVATKGFGLFGPAIKDIFFSAINAITGAAQSFFNFFIENINEILGFADELGADFGEIDLVKSLKIDNESEGKAQELADFVTKTFADRLAKGGNSAELKGAFSGALDFFKGFLPAGVTKEMEALLAAVSDVGKSTKGLSADAIKAGTDYDKLLSKLDPLVDGMKDFAEAQKTINTLLKEGVITNAEGQQTLNLLARSLVGLSNAEFELGQRLELVNRLVKENALNADQAALAMRKFEVEASGAFVSALEGTFPLLEATQKLAEIGITVEENAGRLAAAGITQAEATKRLARESFGLGDTMEQVNEQIDALRKNQKLLGLSSEELAAQTRDITIAFLEQQTTLGAGIDRFFLKYQRDVEDVASATEDLLGKTFEGLEDAIVEFVNTGKLSFKDLVSTIEQELIRLAAKGAIADFAGLLGLGGATQPGQSFLGQAFSGLSGGNPGGGFGQGGLLDGAGGGGGLLSSLTSGISSLFSGFGGGSLTGIDSSLTGFQAGGSFAVNAGNSVANIPGADNRIVAFKAKDGEQITVDPVGGKAERPIEIKFNISTPDANSFRQSQGQILAQTQQALRRAGGRNG